MKRAPGFAASVVAALFVGCTLVTDLDGFATGDGGDAASPGDGGDLGDAVSDGASRDTGVEAATDDECSENGLVALWRMDDGAGTVAKDCSPNALHAPTFKGSPRWVVGHRGGAVELDGNTCFDLGTPAKLAFTTAFSVSLWFYPITFSSDGMVDYIIGKRAYNAPNGWRLGFRNDRPSFEIGVGSDAETLGPSRSSAQWVHVATTYAAGTMTLFINGQSTSTLTTGVPTSIVANSTTFRIGCVGGPPADRLVRGRLDDMRVYSRVLTSAEVLRLYTEGR